jgi:hypothetical protein
VGGGVAKNEGMKLFLWSCNAGCSLLVYGVRIVGVVQMSWLRLQHSELACCTMIAGNGTARLTDTVTCNCAVNGGTDNNESEFLYITLCC